MPSLTDATSSLNETLTVFPYILGFILIIGFVMIFFGPFFSIFKEYFEYKITLIKSKKILKLQNSFETVIDNISLIEFQIDHNNNLLKKSIYSKEINLLNEKLKLKNEEFNEVISKAKI